MCDNCFNKEYYGFYSDAIFLDIWNELKSKISNNQLIELKEFEGYSTKPVIQLGPLGIGSKHFDGCDVYQCKYCHQIWNIAPPENAFRGFLLKEENYPKTETKKERSLRTAKFIYIMILISLLLVALLIS